MIKYRPEIDGLRTVAVLPVVLFHLGYDWIGGGYLGVDVFFVISGFLITSIIMKDLQNGSFSMKDFWIRRVRRIMPALQTMVLVVLLLSPVFVYKDDISTVVTDSLSAIFSYANFNAWIQLGDYWGLAAENSFFLHCWSLSVEEQFYIVYPFLIFLLFKYQLNIKYWIVAILLVSLALFVYGSSKFASATFYMLPMRAWELACGGLVAVAGEEVKKLIRPSWNRYLAFVGICFVIASYFFDTDSGLKLINVFPVFGTALLILFSEKGTLLTGVLSAKPVVYLGKMSYSLYIWHWPVIVLFYKYLNYSALENQVYSFVVMFVLAVGSFHFVENKTRKSRMTLKLVLVSVVFVVASGVFLKSYVSSIVYHSAFNTVAFYGHYYNITPHSGEVKEKKGVYDPARPLEYNSLYCKGGIQFGSDKSVSPDIVVLGDSHGAMWGKVIHEISEENRYKVSFYTSVGMRPVFDFNNTAEIESLPGKGFTMKERADYANDLKKNLELWKPKVLIVSCKWDLMEGDQPWSNFRQLLEMSQKLSIQVLILNQPPVISIGNRNSSQYLPYLGYVSGGKQYIKQANTEKVHQYNQVLNDLVDDFANVSLLDVYSDFANNDDALVISEKEILYFDDDHLSYQGTLRMKDEVKRSLLMLMADYCCL